MFTFSFWLVYKMKMPCILCATNRILKHWQPSSVVWNVKQLFECVCGSSRLHACIGIAFHQHFYPSTPNVLCHRSLHSLHPQHLASAAANLTLLHIGWLPLHIVVNYFARYNSLSYCQFLIFITCFVLFVCAVKCSSFQSIVMLTWHRAHICTNELSIHPKWIVNVCVYSIYVAYVFVSEKKCKRERKCTRRRCVVYRQWTELKTAIINWNSNRQKNVQDIPRTIFISCGPRCNVAC